ncbi:hypothetical protein B296_00032913, partial [Ensete ventricosum]
GRLRAVGVVLVLERSRSAPDEKRSMEAAASRSSRGFDDEDDDDQEFAKREGFFFSHKDLTIKADGKGSGTDDLQTTPRSKHSAMEQRRRNKINDRQVTVMVVYAKISKFCSLCYLFQILRELIPHSDQKRDKASFLLEVKVYYRSFWKNAQNNNQTPVDGLSDPSQVIRNGSAPPASVFAGQFDENDIPAAPAMLSNAPNPTQLDMTTGVPYKIMETATGYANNMHSQAQPHWLGSSSPADCAVSSEMLNEQEELIIDEGTISASASYSQGYAPN